MNKCFWKLTDEEYEFIKGEVIHIFEKYNIKCIPVCGSEIASKMKITLIAYSGLSKRKLKKAMEVSQDGFFMEQNGTEYIFYNDMGRCYERQNWTILHEIGHIVLDHTGHSDQEEDEANFSQNMQLLRLCLFIKLVHNVHKIYMKYLILVMRRLYMHMIIIACGNLDTREYIS